MPSEKSLIEALDKHMESFVHMLKGTPADVFSTGGGIPKAELAQVIATKILYDSSERLERQSLALIDSSKRLERYSIVLIVLTVMLALLTTTLVWRTFLK